MSTAAIPLAAGRSRRFGPADKLLAPLEGATVIEAAMAPLTGVELARRIAVISSPAVADLARNAGFEIVRVAPGPEGPGHDDRQDRSPTGREGGQSAGMKKPAGQHAPPVQR